MKLSKIIVMLIVICGCIAGSVGATYYLMKDISRTELNELTTEYQENTNILASYYQNELDDISTQLEEMTKEFEYVNQSLQENLTQLENILSADTYEFYDPTYSEVAQFMENDNTNTLPYDARDFNCLHFSRTFITNAKQLSMRCALIIINFEETNVSHAIVGFNTTDQGMVYIEPQSDEWVEDLELGNDYWTDCVVSNGIYYHAEEPDDTIREILIFW
jgi:hypothetical protein